MTSKRERRDELEFRDGTRHRCNRARGPAITLKHQIGLSLPLPELGASRPRSAGMNMEAA